MFNRLKQGLDVMRDTQSPDRQTDGMADTVKEFNSRTELWAKVLTVEPGNGKEKRMQLEVHDDDKIYEIGSTTQPPKGKSLAVGDHVALASFKQMTKAEAKRAPGQMLKDELLDEAAFDLLPSWLPIGPKGKKEDRHDNGNLPSWKVDWDKEPNYGAGREKPADG